MWFSRKKKEKTVDLEKGKKIFFEYNGSIFDIEHDLGDEYKDCNVPKELETEWRNNIKILLENKIFNEVASDKFNALLSLIQISTLEEGVQWLFKSISCNNSDTFYMLLLCEQLQNQQKYINDSFLNEKINSTISERATKMLSEPIVIDESFKNDFHMKNYDFSDENIKKRISKLLK